MTKFAILLVILAAGCAHLAEPQTGLYSPPPGSFREETPEETAAREDENSAAAQRYVTANNPCGLSPDRRALRSLAIILGGASYDAYHRNAVATQVELQNAACRSPEAYEAARRQADEDEAEARTAAIQAQLENTQRKLDEAQRHLDETDRKLDDAQRQSQNQQWNRLNHPPQ